MSFYLSEDCREVFHADGLERLLRDGKRAQDERFWKAEWFNGTVKPESIVGYCAEVVTVPNTRPGDELYGPVGPFETLAEAERRREGRGGLIALVAAPRRLDEIFPKFVADLSDLPPFVPLDHSGTGDIGTGGDRAPGRNGASFQKPVTTTDGMDDVPRHEDDGFTGFFLLAALVVIILLVLTVF